jgi:hypothetical protein
MRMQIRQGLHAFGGVWILFALQRIHLFRAFAENSKKISFSFFGGKNEKWPSATSLRSNFFSIILMF